MRLMDERERKQLGAGGASEPTGRGPKDKKEMTSFETRTQVNDYKLRLLRKFINLKHVWSRQGWQGSRQGWC